jgi:hypothetical protein
VSTYSSFPRICRPIKRMVRSPNPRSRPQTRGFDQGYTDPPHCRASTRQVISASNITTPAIPDLASFWGIESPVLTTVVGLKTNVTMATAMAPNAVLYQLIASSPLTRKHTQIHPEAEPPRQSRGVSHQSSKRGPKNRCNAIHTRHYTNKQRSLSHMHSIGYNYQTSTEDSSSAKPRHCSADDERHRAWGGGAYH